MPDVQLPLRVDSKGVLSIQTSMIPGPSRNVNDIIVQSYYKEKAEFNRVLRTRKKDEKLGRGEMRSKILELLEYIPDEEKYDELSAYVDKLDDELLKEMAEKRGVNSPGDLDDTDKEECMRKVCEKIRYKIQLEMNRVHGLVKQRGIGLAFPWFSDGREFFPIEAIPPDGEYVSVLTGRKYSLSLHAILNRGGAQEATFDEQENDLEEMESEEE